MINDCRKKEELHLRRVGGDFEISFIDNETGKQLFVSWFQMKKPYNITYKRIEKIFLSLKDLLKRQD